jgi:arsenate reductase
LAQQVHSSWFIIEAMNRITIYHNGRCGKSRKALEVLEQSGKDFEVVLYLQHPPSEDELSAFASQLGSVEAMVRKKEALYGELFHGRNPSDQELISALHAHPALMERPLVVADGQLLIVRSEEAVERLKAMLEGALHGG